jgi:hypothetical protein
MSWVAKTLTGQIMHRLTDSQINIKLNREIQTS